jgi:hypothetical protein
VVLRWKSSSETARALNCRAETQVDLNVGAETYEEVTVFLLDNPDTVPQPDAE